MRTIILFAILLAGTSIKAQVVKYGDCGSLGIKSGEAYTKGVQFHMDEDSLSRYITHFYLSHEFEIPQSGVAIVQGSVNTDGHFCSRMISSSADISDTYYNLRNALLSSPKWRPAEILNQAQGKDVQLIVKFGGNGIQAELIGEKVNTAVRPKIKQ